MYPVGRLDAKNASIYLGLSEKTLAMMRCNGTGPKFVKRGRIFYFREDLDGWLNAGGRFTSTARPNKRRNKAAWRGKRKTGSRLNAASPVDLPPYLTAYWKAKSISAYPPMRSSC